MSASQGPEKKKSYLGLTKPALKAPEPSIQKNENGSKFHKWGFRAYVAFGAVFFFAVSLYSSNQKVSTEKKLIKSK